mgnify:CR=1 FL=1
MLLAISLLHAACCRGGRHNAPPHSRDRLFGPKPDGHGQLSGLDVGGHGGVVVGGPAVAMHHGAHHPSPITPSMPPQEAKPLLQAPGGMPPAMALGAPGSAGPLHHPALSTSPHGMHTSMQMQAAMAYQRGMPMAGMPLGPGMPTHQPVYHPMHQQPASMHAHLSQPPPQMQMQQQPPHHHHLAHPAASLAAPAAAAAAAAAAAGGMPTMVAVPPAVSGPGSPSAGPTAPSTGGGTGGAGAASPAVTASAPPSMGEPHQPSGAAGAQQPTAAGAAGGAPVAHPRPSYGASGTCPTPLRRHQEGGIVPLATHPPIPSFFRDTPFSLSLSLSLSHSLSLNDLLLTLVR